MFGEIRSLLARGPSERTFEALARLADLHGPSPAARAYLMAHLSRWPAHVRRCLGVREIEDPRLKLCNTFDLDATRSRDLDARLTKLASLGHIHHLVASAQNDRVGSALAAGAPVPKLETLSLRGVSRSFGSIYALGLDARPGRKLGRGRLAALLQRADLQDLRGLGLENQGLRDRAIRLLQSHMPGLRRLELGSNEIGAQGARLLAQRSGLTHLDLSAQRSGLAARSVRALGEGLRGLKTLVVSGNPMGWDELHALSDAAQFPALEQLALSGCEIDDDRLRALIRGGAWSKLRALDLSGNPLTVRGVMSLMSAKTLPALERLWVRGAHIGAQELATIRQDRWRPPTLRLETAQGHPGW